MRAAPANGSSTTVEGPGDELEELEEPALEEPEELEGPGDELEEPEELEEPALEELEPSPVAVSELSGFSAGAPWLSPELDELEPFSA